MKALYININGKNIQSTNEIIVVGKPEDAIINKFFFELGKEILKGVVVPGITSIKKKDLVTDFKVHDERSFNSILEQWDTLKQELLGENPFGSRTIKLPDEYVCWLQNSSQPVYAEIAKSLYKRGGSVEVSLDKIYKNAIGIIVNNIDPEECKDCGQFVVNDDAVTDDSAIAVSIQERIPQIAFVPFEDFGNCPKCGKKPCECVKVKDDMQALKQDSEIFLYAFGNKTIFLQNQKGEKLFRTESSIIANSDKTSEHILKNLVILNEGSFYFVSKSGIYKISESTSNTFRNRFFSIDYSFEIYHDKYLLYRHAREYTLYEILHNGGLLKKYSFSSKVVFVGTEIEISGKYIKKRDYIVDMSNGAFVDVLFPKEEMASVKDETEINHKIECIDGIVYHHVIPNGEKKEIYKLIENEIFLEGNSDFFAIWGNGYIEKYNKFGELIRTIDYIGYLSDVKLWNNGYISYQGGYYDREGVGHSIPSYCCTSRGWQSTRREISEVLSDNCLIIKECISKNRAEESYSFIINGNGNLLVENQIDEIKRKHKYGTFEVKIIDDIHCFCSFTEIDDDNTVYFESIVNYKKGCVVLEKKSHSWFDDTNLFVVI